MEKIDGASKSTATIGKQIHAGYKTGYELIDDMTKEAVRGSNRIDFLDDVNNIIYELKPLNQNGLKNGIAQLRRYKRALGDEYALVLEFY